MRGFDQQTLRDLEFDEIRNWLMQFAIGPSARMRLEALAPSNNFDEIENQLLRLNGRRIVSCT
jgi:dsDNA-specific endonuclease/ATPase MutS2